MIDEWCRCCWTLLLTVCFWCFCLWLFVFVHALMNLMMFDWFMNWWIWWCLSVHDVMNLLMFDWFTNWWICWTSNNSHDDESVEHQTIHEWMNKSQHLKPSTNATHEQTLNPQPQNNHRAKMNSFFNLWTNQLIS